MPNTEFENKLNESNFGKMGSLPSFGPGPSVPIADMSLDQINSSLQNQGNLILNSFQNPFKPQLISPKLVDQTGRYDKQLVGWDNEDLYGQMQSNWDKAANGVLKGLTLAGTTFLQGTVGLVNGLANVVGGNGLNSFYNNDFSNYLEKINKEAENVLPNYYTAQETNAAWYSPDNFFTANFLWDKVIKNIGFSIGAIYSGGVVSKALSTAMKGVGLLSDARQLAALTETLEQVLPQTPVAARVTKFVETLTKALPKLSATQVDRAVTSFFGAATEGGIEALQGLNEFRESKVEEFRAKNFRMPNADEMAKINEESTSLGNARFIMNLGLLSATNYIQLPKILGSRYSTSKALANTEAAAMGEVGATRRLLDGTLERVAPKGLEKVAKNIYKGGGLFFSGSEAFEEGAQFVFQEGTKDYYNKRYGGEGASFIDSLVEGVKKVQTKEGMESILLGGLSGGMQQIRGNIKQRGFLGEGGLQGAATDKQVQEINNTSSLKWFSDMKDAAARGVNLMYEGESFIRQGDILSTKDNEADLMNNYLAVRIKHGRYDLVKEDIAGLRNQGATKEGLDRLKKEGYANENDTVLSFGKRLSNFEKHADLAKTTYEALYLKYGGQYLELPDGSKKKLYSESVIDKMAYAVSKIADYDTRISELSQIPLSKGIPVQSMIDSIVKNDKEAFEISKKDIETFVNNINGTVDEISDLKRDLNDIYIMTNKRQSFLKEYNDIATSPEKYDEPDEKILTPSDTTIVDENGIVKPKTIKITTKDGEEDIEIGTEYYLGDYVKKDAKGRDVYLFPKFTVLGENPDGTIQVKDKDGIRNVSKEEFIKYKPGKVSDTLNNKKAKYYFDNINNIFEFNFGKGKKRKGRLRYSPKDRILEFVYVDGNKTKTIEVTGDQFVPKNGYKQALITKVGTLTVAEEKTLQDFAKEKDDRIQEKRAARLQIIESIVDETGDRIEKVKKSLEEKYRQLDNTVIELDKLEGKIKAGELTKRNNFNAFTQRALNAAKKLVRLRDTLTQEIEALEGEKEELEFNLEYFYDLAQNIDELPTDSADFQEELNEQALDLGILIDETAKSITQATRLLEKTEKALDTAIAWIQENIEAFQKGYPNVPTDIYSQEFIDFLKANPNFLKLRPDFKQDLADLEGMIGEMEEFEIKPLEKLIAELKANIKDVMEELPLLEKQYVAKEVIVNKFNDIALQHKRAEAAKKQAEADAKFLQGIFGTKVNQPSSDNTDTKGDIENEKDSPKKRITSIASTVDESKSTNQTVLENVRRHNSFLNNVSRMPPEKASEIRVTLVNNSNAPAGIMDKALAGYDVPDVDNTVVAIYSNTDGKFVDVNGKATENPDEYVISVMASDKLTSSRGDRYSVPKDVSEEDWHNWYKGMRAKWLAATEPEIYEFTVSGGIPQRNKTNIAYNVTENLISEEQIGQKGLVQVSIDGTINVNGISKKYTPGRVVLVNGNSTAFLNNRNFTDQEAEIIYKSFQTLAATKKGEKWNTSVVKFLRDVMLFGDPTTGDKPKAAARNQFWIDNKGNLNIGPTGFKASFTSEFLALPEVKAGLIKIIKGAYQNVNAATLKSNDKFVEITGFDKEGVPQTRVWQSYQHYLLSPTFALDETLDDKEENGKKRSDVPLTNNLQLPIDGSEPFIQKYSTIVPREDEVVETTTKKKAASKKEAEENTFTAEDTDGEVAKKPSTKKSLTLKERIEAAKKGKQPIAKEEEEEEEGEEKGQVTPEKKEVKKARPSLKERLAAAKISAQEAAQSFVNEVPSTKGNSQNDMALRLMTKTEVERMSDEDHAYFREWMKINLPNIPVAITDQLIQILGTSRLAWGRFTNSGIEIFERAEKGTEFHEAFEAVWNILLEDAQQIDLYEEFINQEGTIFDRETLTTIPKSEASFQQAKEAIADEFGAFMRDIKSIPPKGLIGKFFKWLKDLLKYWVGSKKYRLFTDIHNGKFAKKQKVREFNGNAYSQVIPGTDSLTTREIVEDMAAQVAFVLLGDSESAGFYSSFEHISADELFVEVKRRILGDSPDSKREDKIPGRIRDYVAALLEQSKSLDGRQKSRKDEIDDQITRALEVYDSINQNWEESVKITKEFLRSAFKIKITDEITMDEKENKGRNEYTKNDFLIDTKQNSTSAMKLLFATLVKTDKTGQLIEGTLFPKVEGNSYGGPQLVHSGKSFIEVIKKLAGVNTLKEQLQNLYLLGKNNPDYVRLYTRLKGNLSEEGSLDYDKMDFNDWRLIFDFYTTFAKQAPVPFIVFNNKGNEEQEGETFMAPADLNNLSKLQIQQWIGNLRVIAKTGNNYVKKTKVGKLNAFTVDTSSFKPTTGADDKGILKSNLLPKLALLGIDIDKKLVNKLSKAEATKMRVAAQSLLLNIKIKDATSITANKSSVQGRLNELADIVVRNTDLEQKSTFFNIDNEQQQLFINDNYYSKFANALNNTASLAKFIEDNPQYKDVLLGNSLIFKLGGDYFDKNGNRTEEKLTIAYLNGIQLENDRTKAVDKLNLGERLLTTINALVNGYSNIIMPGDSATEWMMSMKNNIQMEDLSSDVYKKKLKSIFGGYLVDEMNLIVDTPNRVFNYERKGNKLRLLEGILSEEFKKQIYKFTDTKPSPEAVSEFVNKHSDKLLEAVDKFVTIEAESIKNDLTNEGKVVTHYLEGAGTVYSINGLDSAFENEHFGKTKIETDRAYAVLDKKGLDNFFKFVAVNYAINNTEIIKTLFGDVGTFKSIQDSLKRIKSHGSPRKSIASDEQADIALTKLMNNAGKVALKSSDYGYTNFDNVVQTYTLSDFKVVGSPAIYDGNDEYDNVDRSDGQMWAMPTFYREALLKSGMWDAEDFFQYDSAAFRQYYAKRNKAYGKAYAKNLALVAQDLKTIEKGRSSEMVVPLKPIITGAKTGIEYLDTIIDKQSAFPLFFSFTEEGSHLREHFIQNFENSQDYSIVLSGRKKGAQELHNFYNANGTVNKTKISDVSKFTIPLTAFGIQLETSAHEDNSGTRGTQATKLAYVNMYDSAVPVDYKGKKDWFELTEDEKLKESPIYELLRHNEDMLKELTSIGYDSLLKELGIEDNNGKFKVSDYKKLSDRLYDEIVSRESNQNVYDSVKLNEVGKLAIAPEASNNYQVIKNILLSIVDKTVVSPKMHGGAKIQVSSAMWDNDSTLKPYIKKGKKWEEVKDFDSLSPADKEKVRLFSTKLKFYTKNADGTTNPSEVLLPNWFKRKLQQSPKLKNKTDQEILDYLNNTEEGKRILTGVGFRIPTQEINSIEVFKVAGFLHPSLGDTVVVPAEITTKSGGDFDVDKLNTYLKNVYVDAKGDLKLVQYKGTKQESDIFYTNEFLDIAAAEALNLNKKIIKKGNLQATLSAIILGEMSEKGEQKWNRILKNMFGDDATATDIKEELMRKLTDYGKQLKDLEDIDLQEALLQVFIDKMYKQSIQNEYVESFEKIMLLPENYDRLLIPNSDHGMKEMRDNLNKLFGRDKISTSSPLLSLSYINSQRQLSIAGKDNVGIGAIAQVNHSLTQRQPVYIDPAKIVKTYPKDKDFLGDGTIKLRDKKGNPLYNEIVVKGKSYVSLSGKTDKAGKLITDKISAYLNGFVDILKDTFIAELGVNRSNAGIFLFLERIGVPSETVIHFMNQPIIVEYNKLLTQLGKPFLFNTENIDYVLGMFEGGEDSAIINTDNLSKNIETYFKNGKKGWTNVDNSQQRLVLAEFLKYAKMANQLREHIQAVTWDTANFSDFTLMEIKKMLLNNVNKYSIFNTPQDILDNSFLGDLKEKIGNASKAIGSFLKLQAGSGQMAILKTLYPLIDPKDNYLSAREAIKLGNKVTASFLDYLIQTRSNVYGSPLGSYIARQLTDQVNGTAFKVKRIKDDPENTLNQNYAIASLNVMIGEQEGQVNNLRLKLPTKDIFSQNAFIQGLRELKDIDPELYRSIAFASVLQSGTYKSYLSFTDLLPLEDFSALVNPILEMTSDDSSLEWYSEAKLFLKNNWQDQDFVSSTPYLLQKKDKSGWYKPWEVKPKFYQRAVNNFEKITNNSLEHPIFVSRWRQEAGSTLITLKKEDHINFTEVQIKQFKRRGDYQSYKVTVGYQLVMDGSEPYIIYDEKNPAFDKFVYKAVNLYGDGVKAQEYYEDNRPSQLNNGTLHLAQELTDQQVIDSFEGTVKPIAKTPAPVVKRDIEKPKPSSSVVTISDKIVEGDIWYSGGIPIITTNLGGIHGAGLANQAYKKGYIKYKQDGKFGDRGKVITFPVKTVWSDKTDMLLLADSVSQLIKLANANPGKKYSLPLIGLGHGEGSVKMIIPQIKRILDNTKNIKLVLPTESTDRGKQGTARTDKSLSIVEEVKQMLSITISKPVIENKPVVQVKNAPPKQNKGSLAEKLAMRKGPCK